MAKFDPERFDKMTADLNTEDLESVVIVRSPYEVMEPDPEYLSRKS